MKIKLRIGDKEKTFINDFVKARIFKNSLRLNNKLKGSAVDITDPDAFEPLVEFTVTAFDNQFTVDDVWDGLSAQDLQAETVRVFHEVLALGGLEFSTQSSGNLDVDEGKQQVK